MCLSNSAPSSNASSHSLNRGVALPAGGNSLDGLRLFGRGEALADLAGFGFLASCSPCVSQSGAPPVSKLLAHCFDGAKVCPLGILLVELVSLKLLQAQH